ncbi:hypothetical protein CWD78_17430 [Dickeya dadantii]|nr:hypothetical protein [Dickeya dadantii]
MSGGFPQKSVSPPGMMWLEGGGRDTITRSAGVVTVEVKKTDATAVRMTGVDAGFDPDRYLLFDTAVLTVDSD